MTVEEKVAKMTKAGKDQVDKFIQCLAYCDYNDAYASWNVIASKEADLIRDRKVMYKIRTMYPNLALWKAWNKHNSNMFMAGVLTTLSIVTLVWLFFKWREMRTYEN